jgi:hypothetical protein
MKDGGNSSNKERAYKVNRMTAKKQEELQYHRVLLRLDKDEDVAVVDVVVVMRNLSLIYYYLYYFWNCPQEQHNRNARNINNNDVVQQCNNKEALSMGTGYRVPGTGTLDLWFRTRYLIPYLTCSTDKHSSEHVSIGTIDLPYVPVPGTDIAYPTLQVLGNGTQRVVDKRKNLKTINACQSS